MINGKHQTQNSALTTNLKIEEKIIGQLDKSEAIKTLGVLFILSNDCQSKHEHM